MKIPIIILALNRISGRLENLDEFNSIMEKFNIQEKDIPKTKQDAVDLFNQVESLKTASKAVKTIATILLSLIGLGLIHSDEGKKILKNLSDSTTTEAMKLITKTMGHEISKDFKIISDAIEQDEAKMDTGKMSIRGVADHFDKLLREKGSMAQHELKQIKKEMDRVLNKKPKGFKYVVMDKGISSDW